MFGGKAGYAERPTSGLEGRGKETDTQKGTPRLPLTLERALLERGWWGKDDQAEARALLGRFLNGLPAGESPDAPTE